MDPSLAPAQLRGRATWLLGQTAHRAQRLGIEQFAAAGANRSHYAVLCALDEFGPASQIDLGRRCGYDRSDMVAIVNELAANGFVERRPDADDRRRNEIRMTAAGRRHMRTLGAIADQVQEDVLAPLSKRDRQQLIRLLRRILEEGEADA